MVGRLRIAFLTTVLPDERRSGGEVVSQELIDALRAAGHDVMVTGWARPGAPTGPQRPIETADAPAATKAAWLVNALARCEPFSVAKYRGNAYARAVPETQPDAWIVDHAQAAWALPAAAAPLIYVAHNVEHLLYAEAAANATGPARWMLGREARMIGALEQRIAKRADLVWALTPEDAGALRDLGASTTSVLAVPGREPAPASAPAERSGVGLIGNWTWGPNAAGLHWFADEVVPALSDGFEVVVAGGGADWLRERARIRYVGRVDDADAFLGAARVVAIPSVAGAGVQVKTLDALASGAWIVATPTALRGIEDPPSTVTVAGEAAAFASALERLVQSEHTVEPAQESIDWAHRRRERFREQVRSDLQRLAP
jgi:glycosyltransferase involved in cell wall biosynthesis